MRAHPFQVTDGVGRTISHTQFQNLVMRAREVGGDKESLPDSPSSPLEEPLEERLFNYFNLTVCSNAPSNSQHLRSKQQ